MVEERSDQDKRSPLIRPKLFNALQFKISGGFGKGSWSHTFLKFLKKIYCFYTNLVFYVFVRMIKWFVCHASNSILLLYIGIIWEECNLVIFPTPPILCWQWASIRMDMGRYWAHNCYINYYDQGRFYFSINPPWWRLDKYNK